MRKMIARKLFAGALVAGMMAVPAGMAFAADSLDDLRGPESSSSQNQGNVPVEKFLQDHQEDNSGNTNQVTNQGNNQGTQHGDPGHPNVNDPVEGKKFELPESKPGDVGEFMKGYQPVTGESLAAANQYLSTPMRWFSYAISGGILLVSSAVFLITMFDLLYITLPFVRPFLYTANTTGTGSQIGGQMGGAGGGSLFGIQWVSDEAVNAAAVQGGESPSQGVHMQQTVWGGGMGMNNPAMTPNQAQKQSRGSVLGTYFRNRIKFMVMLGVALVLLFSSVFMDFGINIGGMIISFIQSNLL